MQLDQTTSVEAHAGSIICFLIQSCSFEVLVLRCQVNTPRGAQLRMEYRGERYGYNVYIHAIGADFGRLEGLCGIFDG